MNATSNKGLTHRHSGAQFIALLLAVLFTSQIYAGGWSVKDTQGVKYKLADQKGKWVVVNFWAPWCPPCIAELPELNALQQQHKDILVIGVSVQYKRKQEVTDMVQKLAVTYPIVYGDEDTAADFGGIEGLPTTFLYSPDGKLVNKQDGPVTQQAIEQAMLQK
jgi:thiol-disulfide isomerase/thioredoxin